MLLDATFLNTQHSMAWIKLIHLGNGLVLILDFVVVALEIRAFRSPFTESIFIY